MNNISPIRRNVATWGIVFIFISLASIFVLIKGNFTKNLIYWSEHHQETSIKPCKGITCMRIGGDILGNAIQNIYESVTELLFMGSETSSLAHKSPWEHAYAVPDTEEKKIVVQSAAFFTTRIILLLPLLWLVFQIFKGFTSQAIFLLLAFMTLSGWPPPVLDLFYGVALTIADWPLSYYNFSQRLPSIYDFATIGFICLLVIYLSHCRIKRWWGIVGMVLVGQLIFENNGITTGVALFIFTLFEPGFTSPQSRLLTALQRIFIAGVTSLTIAIFFFWNVEIAAYDQNASNLGRFGDLPAYFKQYWNSHGYFNFAWINVTIANFVTLVSIPVLFGLCFGFLSGWKRHKDRITTAVISQTELNAAFSSAAGFFSTVIIGLFISGLSSDMGRQISPLLLVVLISAAKLSEYLIGKTNTQQAVQKEL